MNLSYNDETPSLRLVSMPEYLDAVTSSRLLPELNSLVKPGCIHLFDMSDCDFISGTALRVLKITFQEIQKQNSVGALFQVNSKISEIIRITGFSQHFSIFPSREEALIHLQNTDA